MSLPAASLSLALTAVRAVLKYRRRIDVILEEKEVTAGLPFLLPDAPDDDRPFHDAMVEFFESPAGKATLLVKGMEASFATFRENPAAAPIEIAGPLFQLFALASGTRPKRAGPAEPHRLQETGPSSEMVLAYFVVQSQRLSENPAVTRVILATADTLLEFAGANAGLFVSNPKTRRIVEALLDEFAIKRDFDDTRPDRIFTSLLGAAIAAVAGHPEALAERSALRPLFGALAELREELGDDFVASIVSADGLTALLSTYLTHTAADPSLLTRDTALQDILKRTLTRAAEVLPQARDNPEILSGVLEAALLAAADNVEDFLDRRISNQPLLVAVLGSVGNALGSLTPNDNLLAALGGGRLVPEVYRAILRTIEANPDLIRSQVKLNELSAELLAGVAGALASFDGGQGTALPMLEEIAVRSLRTLAEEPALLGKNPGFVTAVLGSLLSAAAAAGTDGFDLDDAEVVFRATLHAAGENLALLDLDETIGGLLSTAVHSVADSGIATAGPGTGRELVIELLGALAANPALWARLNEATLVQPILAAVLNGLGTDPTGLLTGPRLREAGRLLFEVVARHGEGFLRDGLDPDDVQAVLAAALDLADRELGNGLDGANLPAFLRGMLAAFLNDPFPLADLADRLADLFDALRAQLAAL